MGGWLSHTPITIQVYCDKRFQREKNVQKPNGKEE